MNNDIERRALCAEFRVEGGQSPKIIGYAAKFNSLSEEMWGFREQIAPGAFTDAIKNSDVRALFNHDPNMILGRNKAGTLALFEDSVGLRYEITPPDTQTAKDIVESIRRGDISQSSFGFSMRGGGVQEWEDHDDGTSTRTIKKVAQLYDVSPVTYPAYPDTESGLRSAEQVFRDYKAETTEAANRNKDPEQNKAPDFSLARARLDLLEVE